MYKESFSALVCAASITLCMAETTPATPVDPAQPASPAIEAGASESAAPVEAGAPTAAQQAKFIKEMAEFEEALKETGIKENAIPTVEQLSLISKVTTEYMQREDLEDVTIQNIAQIHLMTAFIAAKEASDFVILKEQLELVAKNYPALSQEMELGIVEMFAKGAEELFTQTQSMRDQFAMATQAAAAAAATPAPAPETGEEKPTVVPEEEPAE